MSCSVSSVAVAPPEPRSFQPFECSICQSRFTRHENLKRHAALHARSTESSLSCDLCSATFSRADLRVRHMRRQHPEVPDQRRRNPSVTSSGSAKRRKRARGDSPSLSPTESCGSSLPQLSDDQGGRERREPTLDSWDSYSTSLPLVSGPEPSRSETAPSEDDVTSAPKDSNWSCPWLAASETTFASSLADFNFHQWSPDVLFGNQQQSQQEEWYPSELQIVTGCQLYFEHIANFLPFLHQATFKANETSRALLLSILAVAYQYGEDPECGSKEGSGQALSMQCFYRARKFIAIEEENVDEKLHGLTLVQAYLLLEIYGLMYSTNDDSAYGLKTHSKMITLARAAGLMQPTSTSPTECADLESMWHSFAEVESTKRTIFAIHQIDTLWYQFLSIPRSLSHLEIKHELPCPEVYFTASSSQDWAHKQLCKKQQLGSTVAYPDAVRRLLSDTHLNSVSDFDPYGAINITHFLLSSAREQSGWSSITGMLSMDRIEPLRASLLALSPYMSPSKTSTSTSVSPTPTTRTPSASLREATWETAMIEMQMWSPSHTGGIIATSLDAAAHQMIGMAPTYDLLCKAKIASTIQSHVDWFLRYLDATDVPDAEAPWLILYAFKAFMIAWQLMKGGAEGCMAVVGVRDGQRGQALGWAKKVFGRRARWKLGMVILACLDKLEE